MEQKMELKPYPGIPKSSKLSSGNFGSIRFPLRNFWVFRLNGSHLRNTTKFSEFRSTFLGKIALSFEPIYRK